METWAIVLAAGNGVRFGTAKQFCSVGNVRVVDRAVTMARRACDHVVVVLPAGTPWDGPGVDGVAVGGETRAESVRAGLALVPESAGWILVHDAARPLTTDALWSAVRSALVADVDAVVPGLPVTDTLKRVVDTTVVGTVDRSALIAVQTPQGFRAQALRAAHASGGDATDDAAFIEAHGGTVLWVPGEGTNIKLTHPEDLTVADAILSARENP